MPPAIRWLGEAAVCARQPSDWASGRSRDLRVKPAMHGWHPDNFQNRFRQSQIGTHGCVHISAHEHVGECEHLYV